MNRNVLRNISYGVYVVTSMDGNRPTGCVANSVMQITSQPATIAISINHDNFTNSVIKNFGKFGISILSENVSSEIIGTFGFQSGRTCNKFANIEYELVNNLPVLCDSCGYITCKVVQIVETSTHTIFIGEMIDGEMKEGVPMTYAYYHAVKKGKSPQNAPTYLPDTQEMKGESYQCTICGYIHEGALPHDFQCPICAQGKDKFVKIG